jgi:hypothetical protein
MARCGGSERRWRFWSCLGVCAALGGCSGGELGPGNEPLRGEARSPLYGDQVGFAVGKGLPHGPVGMISYSYPFGGGWLPGMDITNYAGCSATLIEPNVALTADHCFCKDPNPADLTFSIPATGDQPSVWIPAQVIARKGISSMCTAEPPYEAARADLACVKLATPVTAAQVPELNPRVMTSASIASLIMETYDNADDDDAWFWAVGYGGTEWAQSTDSGQRRAGPVPWVEVEYYDTENDPGSVLLFDGPVDEGGATTTAKGDSGGPVLLA